MPILGCTAIVNLKRASDKPGLAMLNEVSTADLQPASGRLSRGHGHGGLCNAMQMYDLLSIEPQH